MDEPKNLHKETASAEIDKHGETALHRAARTGAVEELKRLLEDGQDVDRVSYEGNTALHIAACNGREEAAMYLLHYGADSRRRGEYSQSVLHKAAKGGSVELIKHLLERGQDINQVDWDRNTALHLAAWYGREEAAIYLFENGADSRRVNTNGRNVLHFAAEEGSVELINYFLARGKVIDQVDYHDNTALHLAAASGMEKAAMYLLENGADSKRVNIYCRGVLHMAAEGGSVELIKYLLERGHDINQARRYDDTPLHLAAASGREEAAMYLLENGADSKGVNMLGQNVLHSAAKGGSVELIKYFLERGQDINQVEKVPIRHPFTLLCRIENSNIYLAAASGREKAARHLFENGADSKWVNKYGQALLHNAARGGSVELIKYLLERGQDVNQVDNSGDTPLHLAAEYGREAAARCLLENGADDKRLGGRGKSVLHKAVARSSVEFVKYLLERGQDINQVDESGNSALHLAASYGREEVAIYLLENGADSKRLGKDCRSVLHCAAAGDSVELIKRLLEQGQDINRKDEDGNTALHQAVIYELNEAVKLLLHRGAGMKNVNKDRESVLYSALVASTPGVIAVLLEHDDTILEFPWESLGNRGCLAYAAGSEAVLSFLLAFGASPGRIGKKAVGRDVLSILERDSSYKDETEVERAGTPGSCKRDKKLLRAVRRGDLKLVKSITNKNEACLKGNIQILLLEACRWGHTSVVKYLVDELEIPVYLRGIHTSTPIHEAARRGHVRILKLLFERGTLIDARNEALETPLHQAAKWGKWPAAAFLVKRGARVTTLDKNGNTPLDVAKQNGWEKVAEALQDPSKMLSSSKNDLNYLQEVYDAVVLGTVDLDENLIRQKFVPQNVHGIRDLWVGHKLLEIARRFRRIPKELDGPRLMRTFYHAITGKLFSDEEMDTAEEILKLAREQGLLDEGGPAAIIGDHMTKAEISEKIGSVIHDLNRRVQRLEDGVEEVWSAIYQIKRDNEKGKRQSMYLAFLRLGLSFVPIAGGALGTSVEALEKILKLTSASGLKLSDLCGLTTSMTDAVHAVMTDGRLKTDIEEMQSLRERLSPRFIEALPEIPRSHFLNMVGACFERGIEELREILDEVLKEMRSNMEFVISKDAEEAKSEEIQMFDRLPCRRTRRITQANKRRRL